MRGALPPGQQPGGPTQGHAVTSDTQRRDLERVRRGIKARASGIRKCPRCRQPYIVDIPARVMPLCPDCRPTVLFTCRQCAVRFQGNGEGLALCTCCRAQPSLFDEPS